MTTGYVALFDSSGNGLGIASAANTIDFGSRALTTTGSLSGLSSVSASSLTGTLATAAQPSVTSLVGLTNIGDVLTAATNLFVYTRFYLNPDNGGSPTYNKARIFCDSEDFADVFGAYVNIDLTERASLTIKSTYIQQDISATTLRGVYVSPGFAAYTGNISTAAALDVDTRTGLAGFGGGTLTTLYGARIGSFSVSDASTTVTNAYALRVSVPAIGTNKYTAYFDSGVGIGTTNISTSGYALGVTGNVGINSLTAPTLTSILNVASSTQNTSRITLTGQEFYQAANTSTDGIGLVLGVNRSNNRQLLVVDTANASIATTTNYALRFVIGSVAATIDAISTDGVTGKLLTLGNAGNGAYFPGSVGFGTSTPQASADAVDTMQVRRSFGYGTDGTNTLLALGPSSMDKNFNVTSAFAFRVRTNSGAGTHSTLYLSEYRATDYDNSGRKFPTSNFTDVLSVNSGQVTISSGLLLPTSGGTAANLNHYEELTTTLTFSGIWASNQSVTGRIVRNGKLVTVMIPTLLATANTSARIDLTVGTALAVRFRPALVTYFVVRIASNSVYTSGLLAVGTDGLMQIYATVAGGNFTGAGTGGLDATSVSFHIA